MTRTRKRTKSKNLFRGGITADYDGALIYAVRQLRKYSEEVFEDIDHPVEVLLNHMIYAARSKALLDALVFVYGKTPKQVEADVLKVLKAKMEG